MARKSTPTDDGAKWVLAGVGIVVLAAALGLRYGLLEAGAFPLDCGGTLAEGLDGWCAAKWLLVQSFVGERTGWLSLAGGTAAIVLRCRALAWVGWIGGVAGLVLYSFDPAAVGTLLSLLVLAGDGAQVRRGEPQAGGEPRDGLRVGRFG